jgi:hypothetical protein
MLIWMKRPCAKPGQESIVPESQTSFTRDPRGDDAAKAIEDNQYNGLQYWWTEEYKRNSL